MYRNFGKRICKWTVLSRTCKSITRSFGWTQKATRGKNRYVYPLKNWSAWCNVVRWTTLEQSRYQDSTTLVECTMLMSIVRLIVVRCWQRTVVVTMLLEHEPTIVDEKSLLMVVNNDWTMIVEREQLWTMVVVNCCWQGAAQHCNKLLTTLIRLFIFARVGLRQAVLNNFQTAWLEIHAFMHAIAPRKKYKNYYLLILYVLPWNSIHMEILPAWLFKFIAIIK